MKKERTSANNNLNAFYVQTTRAKYNATFYTSNKLDFIGKIKKEQLKTTTWKLLQYRENAYNDVTEKQTISSVRYGALV